MYRGLSFVQLTSYTVVLFIAFIYLIMKYNNIKHVLLILLILFKGLFDNLSSIIFSDTKLLQIYKIVLFVYAAYILVLYSSQLKKIRFLILIVLLIILLYIYSGIIRNNNNVAFIFSQLLKVILPISLIVFLLKSRNNKRFLLKLNLFIGDFITIQIWLSVIKLCIITTYFEGLVGSISGTTGGGLGTSFPIIALFWYAINYKFDKLKTTDILNYIGLLFIGLETGKRTVIFLFPLILLLLYTYATNHKISRSSYFIILFVPLFFYFGVKLMPSLNKEHKIWGSFDIEFALDYANSYSGITDRKHSNRNIFINKYNNNNNKVFHGRIGALIGITNQMFNDKLPFNKYFGNGPEYIYRADSNEYRNSNYYFNIDHRGSVTAILMILFATGLVGVCFFLLFLTNILKLISYNKYKHVLSIFVLYDLFLYNGTSVTTMPMISFIAILIFLINEFGNNQYTQLAKKNRLGLFK